MSHLRVLIVGASIAGPTAACWFAKTGATVTVIERFPELRTNGHNVDIRNVGVAVMRKMPGMEAAVRARKISMEGICFVRGNGGNVGTIQSTGDPDQQSLVSEYEIYRGDLARILYDLTKENDRITYVFGEQVTSIRQYENNDEHAPVHVEFANGHPAAVFDLVVACDGANSRTRALGLGCGVRDHVQSTNCFASYFSIRGNLNQSKTIAQSYSAVGGRFVGLGPGSSGTTRGALLSFHPRDGPNVTKSFREVQDRGVDAVKEFLAKHFGGAGWRCDEIVKGMLEADDFYASEIVQVRTPSLHRGHFALVGDAGYGSGATGVGTSLAMAGAYVLAGEISRHAGDLPSGLRAYEQRMRPIVEDLQKISPLVPAFLAPQTAWGLWVRNLVLAFVCWSGTLEFAQRHLAGAFANGDKHNLPNYEWAD
ncbi:FAD-dependent monooxygenase asL4 like protein [Verticillium longisporum]|uniref:FAD-dependent monooxygenase asL4 like protein n=1 Tax=Verticillium longisporum TaxID=100787 RepID=A0A8I2ZIX8_VERLO|nr:FAD-dependent monooxygenase asL4 like protein [Verticillium longisporum]KAG7131402.1 FAD-dependent monooxygenase asL4 like protein [Verticillium longisporum]